MRRTRRLLLLAALPAAFLAAALAFVFLRAQHTLTAAAQKAPAAHQLAFTFLPYDASASAAPAAANPGFTPVAPHIAYTAGTLLNGTQDLYLAGPEGVTIQAGLTIPAQAGATRTLRTGYELPVAPITALAQGRPRGVAEPQILVATAGAGLLFLESAGRAPTAIRQLLPKDATFRDLTALLPLATGDILLGTRHHGALLFNGATLIPLPLAIPHADTLEVTALAAPDSTSILIGTRTAGAFYVHAGTVAQATQATGLPDNQILSLASTPTTAYIGTPLGVAQIPLTPDFHPTQTLAPGAFANTLAVAGDTLQIGTLDTGILSLPLAPQPRLRTIAITAPGNPATQRPSITRTDAFLTPMLALADGALVTRTPTGWHPVSPPQTQTLSDRNIAALAFDPAGRLYVGFFDHGLDILNPQGTLQQHFEDDHLFCINRLALDPLRHTLAAATANGLVLFDAAGIPRQTLTRRDGLISNHITDLAFTPSGLALATPAGITFLHATGSSPTGAESLYAFQGLVNNHVYTLAADPAHNQLLAGTLGGLSLLTAQSVTRNFTTTNSALAHNWVTALALLPSGDYLAGTYGAGLQRLTPHGTFTPVDLPPDTPHNLVINPNALLATSTHLYAGTLGQGLLVYTNRTARWTRLTAGLPSLNVTAFAANAGRLYIGTENGLVSIPEASL